VDAVLESVKTFNSGSLRYTWPRFLPAKSTTTDFFTPLKSGILSRLAREPILEAWNKKLSAPSRLVYVPKKYLDKNGEPLTLIPSKETVYLSREYSHDDYDYLKLLDVVEMRDSQFLDDLEHMTSIANQNQHFFRRSPEWHSRLASALAEVWKRSQNESWHGSWNQETNAQRVGDIADRSFRYSGAYNQTAKTKFHERIMKLPLINLRDGNWVCADNNTIFFPGDTDRSEVPGGIDLLVVDPEVAKDLPRKHLMQLLGVTDFKVGNIIQLIIDRQREAHFIAKYLSRVDLISHIHFLYANGWRNMDQTPFWFATEKDARALGKNLYIDDEEDPLSATKFFLNDRTQFQFIHPDYMSANPQDGEGWLEWLKANMNLSSIPRLTRPIRELSPKKWTFELSRDFAFIIKTCPPLDTLKLLCDHWSAYQFWIDPPASESVDKALEVSYRTLKQKISGMMVPCTNGKSCRLDQTFLPVGDAVVEWPGVMPFLDVPDPGNGRWQHLVHFGVSIKRDISYYLRCLETISNTAYDFKQVTLLYEQIQSRCNEDPEKVQ
jgi:hypothetical protein